jgi:tRNA(fMet)-specific endonuclease VapC
VTKYMLDTNICIYVIRNISDRVLRRLRQKRVSEVGISAITLNELEYGVAKSSRPHQNELALMEFVTALELFLYDETAARHYGEIRAYLARQGTTIGSLDML